MVIHYPAKFGWHRCCGSEDMLLVVEEQDSTCSLTSVMAIFSRTHDISCSYTQNFRLIENFPHKYFQMYPVNTGHARLE